MALASLIKAGMIHCDGHRFQEARNIFLQVRALCPTEPHCEIGLGSICFAEGRFDAAIAHYRQALNLNPRDAYAYALLGESQIFQGDRYGAPVSLRRACEIDPNGPYGRLAQCLLTFLESLPTRELRVQDRQI